MSYQLVAVPNDPRIPALVASWPSYESQMRYPRSVWLGNLEDVLREHYPFASSRELSLTARNLAPFPLAQPGRP